MTSPPPRKSQTRSSSFTISLILGLLLIPLSAVAATALISNDGETDEIEAAAIVVDVPETTITTTTGAVAAETVFVTEPPTATRGDLEIACGEEGLELVEREAAETITDLEQAALDALRQICAEEGLELSGPPAPPPVVRTVNVVDSSASAATDGTVSHDESVSGGEDRYDDDHDDDDRYDDDRDDDEDDEGDDD